MSQAKDLNTSKPDIEQIMGQIRNKLKSDLVAQQEAQAKYESLQVLSDPQVKKQSRDLLYSKELKYLNVNHTFPLTVFNPAKITSHRGKIGKWIVKFKRIFVKIIWSGVLAEFLNAQKDYNAHLVRFLNDVSKFVNWRNTTNFNQLAHKIDHDLNSVYEKVENKISNLERESINTLLKDVEQLKAQLKASQQNFQQVDTIVRGHEGIINNIKADPRVNLSVAAPTVVSDYSYLLLENRFRGSEQEISQRLKIYPQIFKNIDGKILEIGCGRGELQELFRDNLIDSYAVDLDPAMVQSAKAKGFDVQLGNGLEHLAQLPDKSLGGLIAIQVVEHLTLDQLKALFKLCLQKIKQGGRVVFETINSESIVALASNYHRDPTHVFPLHPETMRFMLDVSGLKVIEVRKLSAFPKEAELKELELKEFMSPRLEVMIEQLNQNFKQLNQLLYGYQDYCIVAEV